jgi:hypothetical protein
MWCKSVILQVRWLPHVFVSSDRIFIQIFWIVVKEEEAGRT